LQSTFLAVSSTFIGSYSIWLGTCSILLHPRLPLTSTAFKHQYSSVRHLFEKIVLIVRNTALIYVILSILLLASNKHVIQHNNNEGR